MKNYKQLIKELPSKSVVMAFGRFNPPTTGHELLIKAVKKLAQQRSADHVIYASRSQDAKKNPLSVDKKVKYLNLMFKNTHFAAANENVRTFIEAAKELNKKYKNLVMVAGSDRVPEFKRILNQYNGKDFHFDTIDVISAGERDPDADDATGMSASKMRAIAVKGNYDEFKKGLPTTVREIDGRRLMNDIRNGMGLEPIKEQVVLVKDELREKYFRGEVFNEGDIVESNGGRFTIVKRGSNHLLLKEHSTNELTSKWIHDVTPTEEKDMNEELTDKTLKVNDKVKVARMIATMLGIDNAESSSNPESLVNQALRKVRTKALNAEALSILDKMLVLATNVGINYDATLKPTKLKEDVVNKSSKRNIAKDVMRFNDFNKIKRMDEQESEQDKKKDTESDLDFENSKNGRDESEVGNSISEPGKQDNLRRRKSNQIKEAGGPAALRLADALRREQEKRQASEARAKLMLQQKKEKEDLAAKQEKQREDLKTEEVEQIDEISKETAKSYKDKAVMHQVRHASEIYDHEVEGGKKPDPEMHRKLNKVKAGIARADARLNKEEYTCADTAVDMSAYELPTDDFENISDEDIDKMVAQLTDDDYMSEYDSDEFEVVDDETGEEIPDEDEEKKVNEEAIMEVVSRMERMKLKARMARTKSKRERAVKIALKRYSNTETINKRSRRLAIKAMKKKLLRGRDPSKISVGEKERIERTIEKRKKVIARIAMRLSAKVRKIEKERLSHKKFTKESKNA